MYEYNIHLRILPIDRIIPEQVGDRETHHQSKLFRFQVAKGKPGI